MGIRALSSTSVDLPIGGIWTIEVETTDEDGYLTTGTPSVVVTLPGGSTTSPSFSTVTTGVYRATYTVAANGRYVAVVTDASYGSVAFSAYVSTVTASSGMPTVTDVDTYLTQAGVSGSWTTAQKQSALDAEAAAQRAVCKVGAIYPADLKEALLRRVARNLALRAIPIATPTGDAESPLSFIPGRDPEVRRLEAPHRKLVVG